MLNRVLLLLFAVSCCAQPQAADRPNIIVIYTDDHGYADLSCQGVMEDVKTPHIDALAASGVRMTDGYCTAPQCVPSRAGLLTGQFQNRFGLESNPQGKDVDIMRRFAEVKTLPERLQTAGYATGMAGKWHLGPANQISTHGFDSVFFKHSNAPGFWNMTLDGTDTRTHDAKGWRLPPGSDQSIRMHLC
jgi:arylsulfatase A-like enzyme